jgi:hypothetical protein
MEKDDIGDDLWLRGLKKKESQNRNDRIYEYLLTSAGPAPNPLRTHAPI